MHYCSPLTLKTYSTPELYHVHSKTCITNPLVDVIFVDIIVRLCILEGSLSISLYIAYSMYVCVCAAAVTPHILMMLFSPLSSPLVFVFSLTARSPSHSFFLSVCFVPMLCDPFLSREAETDAAGPL